MRLLLRDILSEDGYCVTVLDAWDPAEVKRLRPDMLLLDYRGDEPDSGWGFLTTLKADPETADIPAIFLTADHLAMDARSEDLATLGVRTVLKPFDVAVLVVAVREATAEGASRGAAARNGADRAV